MLFYRGRDTDVEKKALLLQAIVQAVRANAVFGASRIRRRAGRRALRYALHLPQISSTYEVRRRSGR